MHNYQPISSEITKRLPPPYRIVFFLYITFNLLYIASLINAYGDKNYCSSKIWAGPIALTIIAFTHYFFRIYRNKRFYKYPVINKGFEYFLFTEVLLMILVMLYFFNLSIIYIFTIFGTLGVNITIINCFRKFSLDSIKKKLKFIFYTTTFNAIVVYITLWFLYIMSENKIENSANSYIFYFSLLYYFPTVLLRLLCIFGFKSTQLPKKQSYTVRVGILSPKDGFSLIMTLLLTILATIIFFVILSY